MIETGNIKYVKDKIDDIINSNLIDSFPDVGFQIHDLLSQVYKAEKKVDLQIKECKYIIDQYEQYFISGDFDSTMTSVLPLTYYSNAMSAICDIYMSNGEELKIINLLSESLNKIKSVDNGSNSFQIIISSFYGKLAGAYKNIHLYSEAFNTYSQALLLIDKSLGKNSIWYFARLDELADLYLEEGNYFANNTYTLLADSLYTLHLDWILNEHPNEGAYINCLSNLADSKFALQEFSKTREIYLEIYKKYCAATNASNEYKQREIINSLFAIARTYDEENNFIQAEIYHKKQLDYVQNNIKTLNTLEVVYAKHNLASFYKRFNRPKDASLFYHKGGGCWQPILDGGTAMRLWVLISHQSRELFFLRKLKLENRQCFSKDVTVN